MAFGKVSSKQKVKNLTVEQVASSLLVEHFDSLAPHYFLFLLDYPSPNSKQLKALEQDITAVGVTSYCIVSSVTIGYANKKLDATKELLTFESDWRKYLTFRDTPCSAIVAFGRSVRVLNKSADINYYDFLDDQFAPPRYFCGSKYVGGPDKWIYPVSLIDYIYQPTQPNAVCYHTRFFRAQLLRLLRDDYSLDSLDTRPVQIHDCSVDGIPEALDALEGADLLALDTETSGFEQHTDKLGTVQLCADGVNTYFFEWATLKLHMRRFRQVLKSAKRLTLANAKFDLIFLYCNGVRDVFATDDTTLLSHAINSHRPKGLKPGTWFWCGNLGGYDDKLDMIKKKLGVSNYLKIPKQVLMEYAALDPLVTWRQQVALDAWCHHVDEVLPNEKIPEWTIWRFYKEVMMPNARVMTMIQLNGARFDRSVIEEQQTKIQAVIDEERAKMAELWGVSKDFEFSSTDKLGKLFEKMKWPCIAQGANGTYSTSDDVLQEYERLGMPGIKNLKRFRSFMVARNTFCIGWSDCLISHPDGTERVHPNMNLFSVVSFRHSCVEPNLQQIPAAKEIAHLVKQFFVAPPSHEYIEVEDETGTKWNNADYLRVVTKNRGPVLFEDLQEDDEILDYDREYSVYEDGNAFRWYY